MKGFASWPIPAAKAISDRKVVFGDMPKYKTVKERSDGYPGYFHDMIDVFDWDGNHVSRFRTEKPFQHFIVSEDDKRLYAISLDLTTKEQEIDEYDIRAF